MPKKKVVVWIRKTNKNQQKHSKNANYINMSEDSIEMLRKLYNSL